MCAAGKEAGSGERHPRQKKWQVQRGKGKRAEQAGAAKAHASHPVIVPQEDVIGKTSLLVLSLKRTSHLT